MREPDATDTYACRTLAFKLNSEECNYAFFAATMLLSIIAVTALLSLVVFAPSAAANETNEGADDASFTLGEAGGYLQGELSATKRHYAERRFTDPKGHGFAAEEANNFIDRLKGMDAEVVGYDNLENGPDRKIINRDGSVTWIQDKYYQTAKASVDAAFDSEAGRYRYVKDEKPMMLEVPSDQYDEAVELMKQKISEGKVPGVSDPAEAENLVRKGALSYKQAVNLTKSGSITSLKYDASRGVVTSTCAFGISFGIDFLLCMKEGYSVEDAVGEASKNSIVVGSSVFAADVITSQLMKTGMADAMAPSAEAVTKWLGDDACKAILNAAKINPAGLTSSQLAKRAAKVLRGNVVFNVIFTAALTVPDAMDLFNGRISKEQFIKNLAVVVAGIAGATIGAVAGSEIPVLGNIAGGIIGGLIGGAVGVTFADVIADAVFQDDADKMYEIISEKFSSYCEEYVVSTKEGEEVADKLNELMTEDTLKDMFATDDREGFADNLIKPLFEDLANSRTYEEMPSDYSVRTTMLNNLRGIVFIH